MERKTMAKDEVKQVDARPLVQLWKVCRSCGSDQPCYTGNSKDKDRFGVTQYELECLDCGSLWWNKNGRAKDLPMSKRAQIPIPRLTGARRR